MIRDNSEEEYSATPEIPSLPNRISPLKFNQPNNSSNNVIELGDTSEEEEEEVLEELILKRREFLTPPRNLNQGGQIASGSGLNQNNNTINKNNNQIQQRNNNLNSSGIKPIVSPFTTTSTSNNTSTSKGKGKGKAQVIELSDSDDEFTPKAVNKKVFNNDKGPVVLSSDDEGLPLAVRLLSLSFLSCTLLTLSSSCSSQNNLDRNERNQYLPPLPQLQVWPLPLPQQPRRLLRK